MSMIEDHPEVCEICKTGAHEGVALYRTNPKGEKGIFRCNPCWESEPVRVDSQEVGV